mmetsp:Transcript_120826/g.352981  ORF Transcript_120826/g.352981 Transcript_120826/m.352981 type:complete len:213 (-) Transcript_120826:20-658(-)
MLYFATEQGACLRLPCELFAGLLGRRRGPVRDVFIVLLLVVQPHLLPPPLVVDDHLRVVNPSCDEILQALGNWVLLCPLLGSDHGLELVHDFQDLFRRVRHSGGSLIQARGGRILQVERPSQNVCEREEVVNVEHGLQDGIPVLRADLERQDCLAAALLLLLGPIRGQDAAQPELPRGGLRLHTKREEGRHQQERATEGAGHGKMSPGEVTD